jgi:hypothetical protein
VVGIITLLVPVAMLYFRKCPNVLFYFLFAFPGNFNWCTKIVLSRIRSAWAYDRQDKFKALGKFFIKSRSALVLTVFNSFLWLTAALAMTVHSTDAVNCALDGGLVKADSSYASSWANQVCFFTSTKEIQCSRSSLMSNDLV